MRQAARGFTLIEVLVALAVLALALGAALGASGALTRQTQRQSDALLAQICADNSLHAPRLAQQLPDTGTRRVPCPQVGRALDVTLTVRPTPNPSFRRVDAQVFDGATPLLNVSTVIGRF